MVELLRKDVMVDAVKAINRWHPNTPLLLVFSKQKPGPKGNVLGNVESVRDVYDLLFNLEQIGVQDDARQFYLHFCHGESGAKDYPFAIKKPTGNYGKTHQRIITHQDVDKLIGLKAPRPGREVPDNQLALFQETA